MTTSGGPKYFLKGGDAAKEFVFFISSGDDVAAQRDLFDAMVRTTDNQFRQRRDQSRPFTLVVDRWENDAGRRTTTMNEEFVRRACKAHAIVVLLANEIRPGTKEEIEGVLGETDVQVSVIWMDNPENSRKSAALKKYLREHGPQVAYKKAGPPGGDKAICAMVEVITAALADLTHTGRREELFSEER